MAKKFVFIIVTLVAISECQLREFERMQIRMWKIVNCDNFLINIAPSFKVCPRNSPNLAKCVQDAIDHIKPYLRTGKLFLIHF